MAGPQTPEPDGWVRWSPSAPAIGYVALSGILWLSALILWQVSSFGPAVVATGLGAAVPVTGFLLGAFGRTELWVLRVPSVEAAARAVTESVGMSARVVDTKDLPRGHPMRRCARVLRSPDLESLVGWTVPSPGPHPAAPAEPATVYVLATRAAEPLDVLRAAIARSVATPGGTPAD